MPSRTGGPRRNEIWINKKDERQVRIEDILNVWTMVTYIKSGRYVMMPRDSFMKRFRFMEGEQT